MTEIFAPLVELTHLSAGQLQFCFAAVLLASLVRGFSGFALSALIVTSTISVMPPVELLPVNLILEGVAGLLMVRGGIRDADKRIVIGLVIGSTIGVPIGLTLLLYLPVAMTKMLALGVILALALLLLANFRPRGLDSIPGLYISGVIAGIVTGIAGVGGMVVAIYALALGRPARVIRASLVMFLFASEITSAAYFYYYGIFTETAVWRGIMFTPMVIIGVLIGARYFSKANESFYRNFCLGLLIVLAVVGIIRALI